jgi:FHS family L-fucose permease-like MFS transporter
MGPPETSTRRLNLAQAFNPMGCLVGMTVASQLILPSLKISEFRAEQVDSHPEYKTMLPSEVDGRITESLEKFAQTEPEEHGKMQSYDLATIRVPYVIIGLVVLGVMTLFLVSKMPHTGHTEDPIHIKEVLRHLSTFRYVGGVAAQACYVGAQIMCWTFIIHYGMTLLGLTAAQAQRYNIVAMSIFLASRFICTFFLRFVSAGLLLGLLAVAAMALVAGTIFLQGMAGLYCLVAVSACMSLMFPTIYGIALRGLSVDDAKLGSAGLIFAIVGGAALPYLQGMILDMDNFTFGSMTLESVRVSFVLSLLCFLVVAIYGFATIADERRILGA